jgi:hypothetical protein
MKKTHFNPFFFLALLPFLTAAQIMTPIATSGYNLDAVAENTTATSTTGGAIDGSNYVMYSVAYGALFSVTTGVPNNGIASVGTRTYQMQPYTGNNMLYLTFGQTGTLTLNTPASYAGLSLLCFATEGAGVGDITIYFTDNTTQFFSAQSIPDWFNSGNTVMSGFDRCNRTTGTPANSSGNPKMYYLDLPLTCANRSKSVSAIGINNVGTNPRLCIMAVSGAGAPTFSASTTPVTCPGGTNGSGSITATGGIPPYTYTWSTTPQQVNVLASNLGTGTYSYSAQDNGGCIFTGTVAVTQSLATQPPLQVTSNAYSVCSGVSFTLGVSGAATYTWYNGSNASILSPSIITAVTQTIMTYTVSGITNVNCLLTGNVTITVNPLPGANFVSTPGPFCNNSPGVLLGNFVQQTGGVFSGIGVSSNSFIPGNSGVGTFTLTFTKTGTNNCVSTATTLVQVSSLAAPQISITPAVCSNGSAVQMTVNPSGGTFSGSGMSPTGLFTPSVAGAGTQQFFYTIQSGPCTASATSNILVNAAPVASISNSKTFFCKNASSVFINANPIGGTFSGPGMNGTAFNPANANVGNNNIIIYSFTDPNGCTDSASVRITVSTCSGINENSSVGILNIYPNPSSGAVNVTASAPTELYIHNEIGQLVRTIALDEHNGNKCSVEGLAPGLYFLSDSSTRVQQKIVISR